MHLCAANLLTGSEPANDPRPPKWSERSDAGALDHFGFLQFREPLRAAAYKLTVDRFVVLTEERRTNQRHV